MIAFHVENMNQTLVIFTVVYLVLLWKHDAHCPVCRHSPHLDTSLDIHGREKVVGMPPSDLPVGTPLRAFYCFLIDVEV